MNLGSDLKLLRLSFELFGNGGEFLRELAVGFHPQGASRSLKCPLSIFNPSLLHEVLDHWGDDLIEKGDAGTGAHPVHRCIEILDQPFNRIAIAFHPKFFAGLAKAQIGALQRKFLFDPPLLKICSARFSPTTQAFAEGRLIRDGAPDGARICKGIFLRADSHPFV